MMLTTPPAAPEPYRAAAGPRKTSIDSIASAGTQFESPRVSRSPFQP